MFLLLGLLAQPSCVPRPLPPPPAAVVTPEPPSLTPERPPPGPRLVLAQYERPQSGLVSLSDVAWGTDGHYVDVRYTSRGLKAVEILAVDGQGGQTQLLAKAAPRHIKAWLDGYPFVQRPLVAGMPLDIPLLALVAKRHRPEAGRNREAPFALSTQTGRVAYVSLEERLFSCDTEGRDCRNISGSLRAAYGPLFSPQGDHIAFRGCRAVGPRCLYDVYVHGQGGLTRLTRHDDVGFPVWAPSGMELYYDAPTGSTRDPRLRPRGIWAVGLQGAPPRLLTGEGRNTRPQAAPQGELILLQREVKGSPRFSLHRLDAKGTNPRELVPSGVEDGSVRISPSGERIAFAWSDGKAAALKVIDLEGRPVAETTMAGLVGVFSLEWDPKGKRLAFVGLFQGADADGLYILPIVDGE